MIKYITQTHIFVTCSNCCVGCCLLFDYVCNFYLII